MRGLLEKDLRLTLARKQTLLIFSVMALIMGISVNGPFLVGYLTMLATIIAVGTLSYDEFDNGFAFLMTLPFDRKTYVREKYLFCLFMDIVFWCVGIILYGVGAAIRHHSVDLIAELPMLASLIPALYLSAAILIPLQLKYGSEKSRIALFLLFGLIALVVSGSKSFSGSAVNPFAVLSPHLERMPSAVILLSLVAVCALITYASYLWSTRIMEKKEF